MRFVLRHVNGRTFIAPESLASDSASTPISYLSSFDTPSLDSSFPFSKELQHLLQGKQLLLDEVPFPTEQLHDHYLHGYVSYSVGVAVNDQKYVCQRCGNDVQRLFAAFSCARCGASSCTYCRKCIMMGRVSTCTPLVSWCGPNTVYPVRENVLAWQGELSPAQQRASEAVTRAIDHDKEFIVWAVCGAGKTEVLFSGFERALQKGMNVCLASPRTDVILELAPRFRDAFPETELIALYGGSEDRGKQAQLVLSTTHQLLRYKDAFDLIVIDEVDAFPFDTDDMLPYAVEKAKKPNATTVYLTATPDRTAKARFQRGELPGVRIPRRYHGHPLPVPKLVWCGNWQKLLRKYKLPAIVRDWATRQCQKDKQAFLFAPSIEVMRRVTRLLQEVDPRIVGVHAADDERREKIERFRSGDVPIIVTTTILERGVTVANVDVAVFGANDDVFTERALVQMAGRAGRSAEAPDGDVTYFHYGKTTAMVDARRHIELMNREAFPMKGR